MDYTRYMAARKKLGWSQVTLAVKAGVCLSTISIAERSLRCTPEVGLKVAQALGVIFSNPEGAFGSNG